jgi:CheY-like chemotaxis protein
MDNDYILVIDDDPLMRSLFSLVLRPLSLDVEIEYASDGQSALDMVADNRPRLIFLDLKLPDVNGLDFLEQLGHTPETANIPVVIFSGNVNVAQSNGYEWPPQVVEVLEKSTVPVSELRDLVGSQLSQSEV